MTAPVLLDLFGCEGGAASGYARAGFRVLSVDNDPRRARHNPHSWFVGDWREGLARALRSFEVAAVHASPPCQFYSITKHTHSVVYPDLVGPVREALTATGLPYVIENVVGAPLVAPVTLCGTMFGLSARDVVDGNPRLFLRRHRLFESNVFLMAPGPCRCAELKRSGWAVGGVYGGGSSDRAHARNVRRGGYTPAKSVRAALIGADHPMTLRGLSECIPPAYSAFVGEQLLTVLGAAAVPAA